MSDSTAPCGILLIDKPQGWTSFDVCAKLRSLLKTKKIGHAGTLDPMATGLMTVFVGAATRAADILPVSEKRYTADFRLGMTTDTLDITGSVTGRCEDFCVSEADMQNILGRFRGNIMQKPPMYSAVHVDGKRLYQLARNGEEVEREARQVEITLLELLSFDTEKNEGRFDVICSKGTYIRSLIDDIGAALGCGAVMTGLRRTQACGFSVNDAVTMDEAISLAAENALTKRLMPVENAFEIYRAVNITPAQENRYRNGGELSAQRLGKCGKDTFDGEIFRVYGEDFIGLGMMREGSLRPYKRLT